MKNSLLAIACVLYFSSVLGQEYVQPVLDYAPSAQNLFGSTAELKFKQQAEALFVYLPGISLDTIDTIIQLQ
jgi:hypothetical protein